MQFAKLHGARVIVLSSAERKLEKAIALGADEGLNYTTTPEWGKAVRERFAEDGVDHIVEVGGERTLPQSLRAIRAGGTISLIGVLSGPKLAASLGPIVTRQVRLQGISVGNRDAFQAMARAISQSGMRPVIDRTYPFDELHDALNYLSQGAHFGKICIKHAP